MISFTLNEGDCIKKHKEQFPVSKDKRYILLFIHSNQSLQILKNVTLTKQQWFPHRDTFLHVSIFNRANTEFRIMGYLNSHILAKLSSSTFQVQVPVDSFEFTCPDSGSGSGSGSGYGIKQEEKDQDVVMNPKTLGKRTLQDIEKTEVKPSKQLCVQAHISRMFNAYQNIKHWDTAELEAYKLTSKISSHEFINGIDTTILNKIFPIDDKFPVPVNKILVRLVNRRLLNLARLSPHVRSKPTEEQWNKMKVFHSDDVIEDALSLIATQALFRWLKPENPIIIRSTKQWYDYWLEAEMALLELRLTKDLCPKALGLYEGATLANPMVKVPEEVLIWAKQAFPQQTFNKHTNWICIRSLTDKPELKTHAKWSGTCYWIHMEEFPKLILERFRLQFEQCPINSMLLQIGEFLDFYCSPRLQLFQKAWRPRVVFMSAEDYKDYKPVQLWYPRFPRTTLNGQVIRLQDYIEKDDDEMGGPQVPPYPPCSPTETIKKEEKLVKKETYSKQGGEQGGYGGTAGPPISIDVVHQEFKVKSEIKALVLKTKLTQPPKPRIEIQYDCTLHIRHRDLEAYLLECHRRKKPGEENKFNFTAYGGLPAPGKFWIPDHEFLYLIHLSVQKPGKANVLSQIRSDITPFYIDFDLTLPDEYIDLTAPLDGNEHSILSAMQCCVLRWFQADRLDLLVLTACGLLPEPDKRYRSSYRIIWFSLPCLSLQQQKLRIGLIRHLICTFGPTLRGMEWNDILDENSNLDGMGSRPLFQESQKWKRCDKCSEKKPEKSKKCPTGKCRLQRNNRPQIPFLLYIDRVTQSLSWPKIPVKSWCQSWYEILEERQMVKIEEKKEGSDSEDEYPDILKPGEKPLKEPSKTFLQILRESKPIEAKYPFQNAFTLLNALETKASFSHFVLLSTIRRASNVRLAYFRDCTIEGSVLGWRGAGVASGSAGGDGRGDWQGLDKEDIKRACIGALLKPFLGDKVSLYKVKERKKDGTELQYKGNCHPQSAWCVHNSRPGKHYVHEQNGSFFFLTASGAYLNDYKCSKLLKRESLYFPWTNQDLVQQLFEGSQKIIKKQLSVYELACMFDDMVEFDESFNITFD